MNYLLSNSTLTLMLIILTGKIIEIIIFSMDVELFQTNVNIILNRVLVSSSREATYL